MAWTLLKYTPGRIDKAGIALRKNKETDEDLNVVGNWRSSHGFPLQVIKMLLKQRAHSVEKTAVVAQRQKRLASIKTKLQRETTRLTQMQDLGGCRAVMSDMKALDVLKQKFARGLMKNPKGRHKLLWLKDYVSQPKPDGYRGIHYIYEYCSKSKDRNEFNGQVIEVQIRTKLQHAWATAVETVDAVTGQALKSALKTNIGDIKWRRLFALMGTEMALREKTKVVPGTPTTATEVRTELKILATETGIINILRGIGTAISFLGDKPVPKAAAYILILDTTGNGSVRMMSFSKRQLLLADQEYLRLEKENEDKPNIYIVRVSVESVDQLNAAYPNYRLDADAFVAALERAVQ